MKKIILITISTILLSMVLMGASYAKSSGTVCESNTDCTAPGEKCIEGNCFNPIDILLFRAGEFEGVTDENAPEIYAVKELPEIGLEDVFKTIIKTILGAAMLLTIAAIVVAAIYYILSRGNEEDTSKAKNIILYLVIGMVIMAAAYGLVSGVVQFDFFKAK
ncbi:hypothetical protein KA005_03695 [bacterium]|nr:hypothetical protein [bacterium]